MEHSFIFLLAFVVASVAATDYYHDYVVVGAGPAGVQLGYFLNKKNRDYIVLERGPGAGSFFTRFPRHDKLISINKRYTGNVNKEFNLRHDWNSLLSDNDTLLFGNYDKDFFPHRNNLVRYFNDFQKSNGIKVRFNTDVRGIRHYTDDSGEGYMYTMGDQYGNTFTAKTVVVLTGTWQPEIPNAPGIELFEGYEDVSVDPKDFEGKTVLIIGRGNAAFETADRIYGVTNIVHMIGRSRIKMAWGTNYVGDIRALNAQLLDTYQLKSLDAVAEANVENLSFRKNGSKFYMDYISKTRGSFADTFDNFAFRDGYDVMIRSLGFKFNFSLFDSSMNFHLSGGHRLTKYPKIAHNYESIDHPGLFFGGSASHSLDYRKSSGGFIHGFRYISRVISRLLDWRNHQEKWPSVTLPLDELVNTFLRRMNEASGLYEMFGTFCDVAILNEDSFTYIEEFPANLLHEFTQRTGHEAKRIIVLTDEFKQELFGPGKDVFYYQRVIADPAIAHHSGTIHPIMYYYKSMPTPEMVHSRKLKDYLPRPDLIHHVIGDLYTKYTASHNHILPMRRFVETALNHDVRKFYTEECVQLALTHQTLPLDCKSQFHGGTGLAAIENGFEFIPNVLGLSSSI